MSVTLYQMEHSPFCIPISRALEACGVDFETVEVPNHDRSLVVEASQGAYYQVPLLIDNKRAIFETKPDSQNIARHINKQYAGNRLFPPLVQGMQEILIEHLENDLEAVTFKLVDPDYIEEMTSLEKRMMIVRHKERKFGQGCIEDWRRNRAELTAEAMRLLGRFDNMLASSPFVLGEEPVYCDFLLYGILGNYTWHSHNQIPPYQRHLVKWFKTMYKFSYSDPS